MEKSTDLEIPIPVSPSDSDHDHHAYHSDESPVGSPDAAEIHILPPSDQNQAVVLTDDLCLKIIKQVEYYFSDENLPNNIFLMKYVARNVDGFVPIGVIASFGRMKKLTKDVSLIVAALKKSQLVVMSANGKKVKRRHPLPMAEGRDPMACMILVENLPTDHSVENLHRVFSEAGSIRNISIHDPNEVKDPKKYIVSEKLIQGKLHAVVEYETVEAAEKAVLSLNNEQDWRFGLRVKLLNKVNKSGPKKKSRKEPESDKSGSVHISVRSGNEDIHNSSKQHESHGEEIVDQTSKDKNLLHLPKEKNGNKGRNQGHGRRQKLPSHNGYGHGIEHSRPPPGPKMPDGTRGFTFGRGRSPVTGS